MWAFEHLSEEFGEGLFTEHLHFNGLLVHASGDWFRADCTTRQPWIMAFFALHKAKQYVS
jgi:hypothetical protein